MKLALLWNKIEKEGLALAVVVAAAVWLKFFTVDFRIAYVLDWPAFGMTSHHILRSIMRAAAVSLPSLAAVLCLVVPASMTPLKWRFAALITADFLLSFLVITDTLFIRYYTDIFIFHDIMLIPQTGLIVKSIWSLLKPWDILYFSDIICIWMLMCKKRLNVIFKPLSLRCVTYLVLIIVFSLSSQLFVLTMLKKARPKIINAMYDRLSVCAWVSTASFHWGDALTLAAKQMQSDYVPQDKVEEISRWFSNRENQKPNGLTKGKNLILVQCEALQYFVIGLTINEREVTPNLNKFSRESLYFTNAWDQTAGGQSSDSEFMANTGLFPASSGAAYTRFSDNNFNSIAGALKNRGYDAVVVQGTYSAFWNCHRMHPKLGFRKQYSRNTYPKGEVIGLGLSDKTIFTEAAAIFSRLKRPFYGFIVTLSGHHPYDFEGLDDSSLPLPLSMKGTMLGNYLIAMHYFDKQFGRFIEQLRGNGLLSQSLIVVYGDHPALPIAYKEDLEDLLGESLEDPIKWKKTRRVPLLFHLPLKAGLSVQSDVNTGQMDILPTVAGLMGIKYKTAFGKDLLSLNDREPLIFRNGSYIYKNIFVEPGVERATALDDGERRDIKQYDNITADVEKRLEYNDLIQEKNLIEPILRDSN